MQPISLRQWSRRTEPRISPVETSITCPMPILLDDADYKLFIGSRQRKKEYELPLDPSGFAIVPGARVIGPKLVVASSDGFVFFETYWDLSNLNDGRFFTLKPGNPPHALLRNTPPTRRIPRAILLGNPMSANYHHWIINCLPRLRVRELLPELADWPVIVQGPLNAFQRDSLAAMEVKAIELHDGGVWEVDELALPGNGVFAPTEMRWLRERLLAGLGISRQPPRRIYGGFISRERMQPADASPTNPR